MMESYNSTMKTSITMLSSKIEIMIRFLKEIPNFSVEMKSTHTFQQLLRKIRLICMQLKIPNMDNNINVLPPTSDVVIDVSNCYYSIICLYVCWSFYINLYNIVFRKSWKR